MNFDETVYPLTEFLTANNFSVKSKSLHFVEYASSSAAITIAYSNLEHVFYTHVGPNSESLIEFTPTAVKTVFNDNTFQFQSTLTISNLISFLNGAGKPILLGDKDTFKKLGEFWETQSREFNKKMMYLQNIQGADQAWKEKNYSNFAKCIERIDKDLLTATYLKKYQIALDKLQRER